MFIHNIIKEIFEIIYAVLNFHMTVNINMTENQQQTLTNFDIKTSAMDGRKHNLNRIESS